MFIYISSRAALNDRDLDPGGGGCTPLYDLYGDVPLVRVCFLSSLFLYRVYNFVQVCPEQGI